MGKVGCDIWKKWVGGWAQKNKYLDQIQHTAHYFPTHCHPRIFRSGSNSNEQAFALFDEDGKGRICLRDLRKVSAELGETLCDEELQAMIDEFDDDHDGQISYDEFVTIMRSAAVDDDS